MRYKVANIDKLIRVFISRTYKRMQFFKLTSSYFFLK